ncbi:MAG: isopenicillin N synthase family dioxygenase [Burkholderiaceae bacterium]
MSNKPYIENVPLVDFGPYRNGDAQAKAKVVEEIRFACENVGFMYLGGDHGMAPDQFDRLIGVARDFFAQPIDFKMQLRGTPGSPRGYIPMQAHQRAGTSAPDLHEAYKFEAEWPADDPDVIAGDRLRFQNKWPPGMPEFRRVLTEYFTFMTGLGDDLLGAFALALGLPEKHFHQHYRKPLDMMTIHHYPPSPAGFKENAYSLHPHVDDVAFTILAQDDVGGLLIEVEPDRWLLAPPLPNTFVINIGSLIQRWSNGRFPATLHKVINESGRERFSVPWFSIPDFDTVVEPLPQFVAEGDKPKYPPLTVGPYFVKKFSRDWTY